jgi:hypothetical protein
MDHPAPLDVLKMTILATADKTDWRGLSALSVVALVFKPLRRFETLEACEPHLFTNTVGQMSEKDSSNTHEVIGTIFRAMERHPSERSQR